MQPVYSIVRAAAISFVVLISIQATRPALAQPDREKEPLSFDGNIQGLLKRYCFKCHNNDEPSGDVNLAKDENPRLIAENGVVWRTALAKVEAKEMPPEDARQPSDQDRELIAKFLNLTLGEVNCEGPSDPGKPSIRRLNRAEYTNSIRYLTGLDLHVADEFAADASSYGFDNIAASLTLTPLQVDQYYSAATKVVEALLDDKQSESQTGYRRVYFTNAEQAGSDRAAAKKIIQRFAKRAFRRPVESEWIDRSLVIYDRSREQNKDHEAAIGNMLSTVLISPRFLMRAELPNPDLDEPFLVDDFDLASRLSFFVWSGPPDDELFKLASKKKLHEPEVLDTQIRRMLVDQRSDALIENFFAPWLQFNGVQDHLPDKKSFPGFSDDLRSAIAAEPRLFLADLIRADRSIIELIDANYAFVNERLAAHYGLEKVPGNSIQRVVLTDRRRGGLLTSAALLMIQADPGRTNVPRRGNFIAATILGTPAPPPPPDVPELKEPEASADKPLTVRERLEIHRSNSTCASCHAKIDPLGFAFENYDAIGAWRDSEVGKPIDASGELPSGRKFNGPIELKDILLENKESFVEVFASQLLIYALGRGPIAADQCVIEDAVEAAKKNEYRLSSIVRSIVHSYPFQYRRNPEF